MLLYINKYTLIKFLKSMDKLLELNFTLTFDFK